MNKHIIDAGHWSDDDYLIIESKTGVFYTDQVGGQACLHPEVEGFYQSLWFCIDDEIACKKGCCYMQEEDNEENRLLIAKEIDKELFGQTHNAIIKIAFDFNRTREMQEGFYPVLINYDYKDDFHNRSNRYLYKGFLITGNCD